MAKLYRFLVRAERAFHQWASPISLAGDLPRSEKAKPAAEAGNHLRDYFQENRIYLAPELCELIAKLDRTLSTAFVDLGSAGETGADNLKRWQTTWDLVSRGVPEIRAEIEREFRQILGVTSGSSKEGGNEP